ncbi:MAG: ABC transporter permease [Luteolibacter sp.]|uniref:ABC transporter permease n=1 Tax=Luteolibacter sp. TaxID=1962973 RepID=UPI0032656BA6
MSFLTQLVSVAFFNLRTLPQRKGAALTAAIGIAGVVGVLVGVLAIAEGFRQAMTASGSPDVAVVLRSGSDSEMTSGLDRDTVRTISDAAGIATNAKGPITSAELFVIINLPKYSTGTDANVPLRGVEQGAFEVRGNINLIEGRRFETGKNEIMVGVGAARAFAGLDVGKQIKVGQNLWTVVGIFTSKGGIAESEIWTDAAVLQPAYHRDDFQSVYVKLANPDSFATFKDTLTTNPKLEVKVARQSEFYEEQSTLVTHFIKTIGFFIASLMAIGALFGALNTMYSAVAARTREISTLRALGFGTSPVIFSVLTESIVLSILGGILGAGGAYLLFDGYRASTINWQTFSQVTFAFRVTPALLVMAIIFATVIGVIGGLFPAIRAARLSIASGLRES